MDFSDKLKKKFLFLVGSVLLLVLLLPMVFENPQHWNALATKSENANSSLGVGLNAIGDWSTELPFLDHFKSSRKWLTQCDDGQVACEKGEWDTQEYDKLNLDENGWVKSLPRPEDSPKYTTVGTLLLREIPNKFPGGRYVVLYEGQGKIEYSFDAKKIDAESQSGRDVIDVNPASGAGIWLKIIETDPNNNGNYIRNIKVIQEEYENAYKNGEIFNPVFIEKIKKFRALRFMDWMQTNNSEQKEWQNRPTTETVSYALKGVPVEVMAALANKVNADAWFNMPHQATDEYIRNFALMVKENLNPNLIAYVEFSNEVWNWQFEQAQYASQQGKAKWGQDKDESYMNWYGMRTAQTCDIWKDVFKDNKQRVKCVISTQTGSQGLEETILECPFWVAEGNKPCYQHGIDAYAITGYFSGKLGDKENLKTIESWWQDSDGGFAKAFQQLKEGNVLGDGTSSDSLDKNLNSFLYQAKVAKDKGLQLVAYEGGQHIVGSFGLENNEKLTSFFIALNRHPEMYALYTQLLNNWKQAGGTLFMHFVDINEPSKWGSWGALEYVSQASSPKYNALINFIDKNPCWWEGCKKN